MSNNIVSMPTPMNVLAERIRAALVRAEASHLEWIEATLDLAATLKEARDRFPSNADFAHWLIDNELDLLRHQERAALINMAADLALARVVLQETNRASWEWIYREEYQPRVTQVRKTVPLADFTTQSQEIEQNPQAKSETPLQENTNTKDENDLPRARLATKGKTSGRPSPISHLPESDLVGGHLLAVETRLALSKFVKERGGRAVWNLVIESIKRGYFGEPSDASIKIPSLRLVMPWLPARALREFDIRKPKVQDLVREVIFPLLDNESHLRSTEHHHKIEGRIEARRRQIEEQQRREIILSQHKEQVAQSTLPVNEQPVIAYGDPLWPPLGDLSARFTFEELCHACWYADYFMGIARPDWKPRELAMAARHLTKYIEPLRPGFVRAVDAIFNAYQAQPDGEKRFPRTPVNFGLS